MANEIRFGTDGWRGIIGWDFTFQNIYLLAQALADYVKENAPGDDAKQPKVFVGYDNRFMSERVAKDIADILCSNKLDAVLSSVAVSSPVAACLTLNKFWLSVMVTASHNEAHFNGVKVKIGGGSASVRVTKDIEALIGKNPLTKLPHQTAAAKDLTDIYFKYVKAHAVTKKIGSFKGKVAVDYMYGSAAGYVEQFLPSKQVFALHNTHDPTFGGGRPEPVERNLTELKKLVLEKKAALGIAFDGDGDRVSLIDEKGAYLTPCLIAAVICDYLIKHKKLKGNIVQSYSMGFLLKRIARKYDMIFEEVNIGFKHVAERIALDDVAFGVEESGGFAWKGNLPDRDGLGVALAFLEIMGATGKKASELCSDIAKEYGASVYIRRDLEITKPIDKNFMADKLRKRLPKKINNRKVEQAFTTDGLKVVLDNDDWLLIRPAGTERVLRIHAETASKKETLALLDFAEKLAVGFQKTK